ncbi:MAG: zinc transporter ZntB [Thiotrichales bacterium]|nr:zinc transporter ZntB [Thiotrichales bacterium]
MKNPIQISEGLAHAYLLDGQGGAKSLSWSEVTRWNPSMGKLWLHFFYTDENVQAWMHQHSGLAPLVTQALLLEETRPRVAALEDGLLIALRGVNLNPGANPEDMVSIRLWIDENWVVSTHQRSLLSTKDVLAQLDRGKGPRNNAEILVNLCDSLIWRMSDTVTLLEDNMAELEDSTLSENRSALRFELSSLRRQTITLRRYLSPQREAINRLMVENVSWFEDDNRMKMREVSDRLIRHLEDIDAVRERAAVTHEELLSRASEQLNERMYVLSILSAIFLPLGFFTGLLGINVGGIPGADNPQAFVIFIGILGLIVGFQVWLFKRKNWL